MDKFEIYSLLFTDSLVSGLAFTASKEIMFYAAKAFGSVSLQKILAISVMANFIANLINYFFGKALFNIFSNINKDAKQEVERSNKMLKLAKYKNSLLLLSVIPFFGKFIVVIAGFAKFPIFRTLLICAVLKICYHGLVI
jgi:membrane protein YqaA with SNARE-associated domain